MYIDPRHNRRKFLKQLAAIAGTGFLLSSCKNDATAHIKGGMTGANSGRGHLLRDHARLPLPTETIRITVLIAGSGIAGLSARHWLEQHGVTDVLTLELDDKVGGNAAYGKNEVSAYPLGAHYLPVPDIRNRELIEFLQQTGVITSFSKDGLPVYNEYYLCHDPEERLFINGYWQEGLVPDFGVPDSEKEQIKRFFSRMDTFRQAKGSDGKDAFAIPLDHSSQDPAYTILDKRSFKDWLHDEGYTSPYLLWYLDYGCKDDYGCNLHNTSAWAGIHYFASRKGTAANATSSTVLTWPEGNGFLMDRLKEQGNSTIKAGWLVYDITPETDSVNVLAYDTARNVSVKINAQKLLLATPQYVNKYLLKGIVAEENLVARNEFQYAPWIIANMVVNGLPETSGQPLCWDNVLYGTPSVGYVNANHQDISNSLKKVLTFYWPITGDDFATARKTVLEKEYKQWQRMILQEMELAHKGVAKFVERMDIHVWGHGMIAPSPGFIWGKARAVAREKVDDKIYFAHSDLSGISIFEEAFYQGLTAANDILSTL